MSARFHTLHDTVHETFAEAVRLAAGLDTLSNRIEERGDPHFAATITAIASLLRTCAEGRLPGTHPAACRAGAPLH